MIWKGVVGIMKKMDLRDRVKALNESMLDLQEDLMRDQLEWAADEVNALRTRCVAMLRARMVRKGGS
jgi:hypothetical protein